MSTTTDYDKHAEDFLKRFNISLKVKRSGNSAPPWKENGKSHGYRYLVTLSRGELGCDYREVKFPFWDSIAAREKGEELTPYGVLACISGDIYYPDTFEEFCSEYGYDADSRKAEATFNRCHEFAIRLREFFATDEEQEALAEIQ